MGSTVGFERAGVYGVGECKGLAEGDGEAFAGDGVGRAGSVSNEGDRVSRDAVQFAGGGYCTALPGDDLGGIEALRNRRKFVEDMSSVAVRIASDIDDADTVGRDGCEVNLATAAPVDFDEVQATGCRIDTVVSAKTITERTAAGAIQACPFADGRGLAVGSDEPAEADRLAVDERRAAGICVSRQITGGKLYVAIPAQVGTGFAGAICKQGMQMRAANSDPCSVRKAGIDAMGGVLEPDAFKKMAVTLVEVNA